MVIWDSAVEGSKEGNATIVVLGNLILWSDRAGSRAFGVS